VEFANGSKSTPGLLWNVVWQRVKVLQKELPFYRPEPDRLSPKMPARRDGHAAVADVTEGARNMYVMGGNGPRGALSDLWRFNVGQRRWEQLATMPSGRYGHTANIWGGHIWVFGGDNPRGRREGHGLSADLLVYDIESDNWKSIEQSDDWPGARCRHGSVLMLDSITGMSSDGASSSAQLFIVAGHGPTRADANAKRDKLRDVWCGTVRLSEGIPSVQWARYRNLSRPCQRPFVFSSGGRLVIVGGFGQSLTKLRIIGPLDNAGQEPTECDVVTTHNALSFEEFTEFESSKSYAGFAAVFDEQTDRMLMFGGGNVPPRGSAKKQASNHRGSAFGYSDDGQARPSRSMVLTRSGAAGTKKQKEVWSWSRLTAHEDLDAEYRLPCLQSWSGCLINHEVLLFGGRRGDKFSNDLYAVPVRDRSDGALVKKTKMHARRLAKCLTSAPAHVQGDCITAAEEQLGKSLDQHGRKLASITFVPTVQNRETRLRVMSLNVHGWSSRDRRHINDHQVRALVQEWSPDTVCLQEVKVTMPEGPEDHHGVVRVGKGKELFRYCREDDPSAVARQLLAFVGASPSTNTQEAFNAWPEFLADPAIAGYLTKLSGWEGSKVGGKSPPATLTSLQLTAARR